MLIHELGPSPLDIVCDDFLIFLIQSDGLYFLAILAHLVFKLIDFEYDFPEVATGRKLELIIHRHLNKL